MASCPGCRKKYWVKGGAIRIPDEVASLGYYEVPICKKCAQFLEENDHKLVYDKTETGNIDR